MNTTKDLNYKLFIQREEGFERTSFGSEFDKYKTISSGDVEKVKQNLAVIKKNYLAGKGVLSDDPVRNVRYHFIVSVAIISRVCVDSGMDHDTAYTLSDIYIQRADKCSSCEKLVDMLEEMQLDFAERMKDLKKSNIISIHIRKCIDYIYEHLHEKITVEQTAEYLKIDKSYLSKLFMKENGISFRQFIINARVQVAKNMLLYSDYSYADVSASLGFSSQSAFISTFKKSVGMTPKQYREMYYGQSTLTHT